MSFYRLKIKNLLNKIRFIYMDKNKSIKQQFNDFKSCKLGHFKR